MIKKLKKFEKKYMLRICELQISHMKRIINCFLIYGLIGYFLLSKISFVLVDGKYVFGIYLKITIAMILFIYGGSKIIKVENTNARYHFCNIGIFLMTQSYLIWSLMAVDCLYQEIHHLNMLPWFIIYIVCTSSFFYRYDVFCIMSLINIMYMMKSNRGYNDSDARFVLPYAMTFVVMSVIIYIFKHHREINLFEKQLEYEGKVEVKNLFTASMNHELRTPLNSIAGNAQILLSSSSLDASGKEMVETIYNTSNVMVQLVNDLLDYSKIDAGEFVIVNNEFNIELLRNNISSMMQQLADEKGLGFEVNIEEGTPLYIEGDIRRIQQIVINIISNGIKYTSSGRVKTHFSVHDNKLKIVTIDTGMGMSEEAQKEMFTPYKRFNEEKTSTIQGTGLGMFVVKQLLDQMHGTINIRSVVDLGTEINIEIPVKITNTEKVYHKVDEHKEDSLVKEEKTYDFTGKVILTVDDTVINNKIVQNILESVGATTYCVLDGENCLKFISSHDVDLILLDHIMPGMDGVECLRRIRNSQSSYKDVPVIMLSGNTDDKNIEYYKENKANGFLAKPIMVDQLFSTIDNILN